jgi:hypothetical protein
VYEKLLPPRHDPESETVVPPHKTIRIRMLYPPPKQGVTALSATSVNVKYVAFADDTWSGSQADVEYLFKGRGTDADAIARILPVLREALDEGATVEALHTALARLAGKDRPDYESSERQVTRTNIQLLLDGKIPETPRAFLEIWIDGLDSRRAVYQSHSRPAQNGPGGA